MCSAKWHGMTWRGVPLEHIVWRRVYRPCHCIIEFVWISNSLPYCQSTTEDDKIPSPSPLPELVSRHMLLQLFVSTIGIHSTAAKVYLTNPIVTVDQLYYYDMHFLRVLISCLYLSLPLVLFLPTVFAVWCHYLQTFETWNVQSEMESDMRQWVIDIWKLLLLFQILNTFCHSFSRWKMVENHIRSACISLICAFCCCYRRHKMCVHVFVASLVCLLHRVHMCIFLAQMFSSIFFSSPSNRKNGKYIVWDLWCVLCGEYVFSIYVPNRLRTIHILHFALSFYHCMRSPDSLRFVARIWHIFYLDT